MKKTILAIFAAIFMVACNSTDSKQSSESSDKENKVNESTVVNLNIEDKKALNIFFSNFSETDLKSFTQDKGAGDEEMIRFGVLHNYINKFSKFEKLDEYNVKIKKEFVDETSKKYFGKTILNHKAIEGIKFSKGFYSIPLADGEAYTFSQIDQLFDIGEQKYKAEVTVYTASSGWTGDSHADPATYGKEVDGPKAAYKVKAVILKNDKGEYTLLEYVRV